MTNTNKLFTAIQSLHSRTQPPDFVPSIPNFPFPQMYSGQKTCLDAMTNFTQCTLTSPTGSGKTAVYLTLTRGVPSIIISPRKFLQKQTAEYFGDYVLFGKSEYPCKFAANASQAPCNVKTPCDRVTMPADCKKCSGGDCTVFQSKGKMYKYPCEGCKYIEAVGEAHRVIRSGGTAVCNFGNFWNLLKDAKVVVVDEADLFFREISTPMVMSYTKLKDGIGSIKEMLVREQAGLQKAVKDSPASQTYSIQNKLYSINFLLEHHELCFQYQRKDKIYVEINPENVSVLKDKIFKGKRLLVVSATLGELGLPSHSYKVWQRRGVFYSPVGKLTSRNLKANPWIMNNAADKIEEISMIAEGLYDTHKFPIHCGNLGTHATALNMLLGPDRTGINCPTCGEHQKGLGVDDDHVVCEKCGAKWDLLPEMCVLHQRGSLMQTIDRFVESDKRYLLLAGADYGLDPIDKKTGKPWATFQFVLKYPYPSLDDRMRTLERVMGKERFNVYYRTDARNRCIQQCGRVCRGFGDFGVTVILDSKFWEEYQHEKGVYPEWFRESVDERVY